jgi:hypothetical protein
MAVTTEVIENSYTASAGADEFVFTFPVHEASWLKVFQNGDLLVLDTDYTVEGLGEDDGGTITLVAPAEAGDEIVITLDIPITQETVYTFNSKFPEKAHEAALDKLTLICLLLNSHVANLIQKGTEAVGAGEWEVDIVFTNAADNDDYEIYITPKWNTSYWVSNVTAAGFKVNFNTVPSSSSSFYWRADASA